ncbi:hypothetical protein [Hyphomonas sp. BRH_c22]|uniref:hypothetical protein n=1 Tax=Hyphomonas sp. BRH_c22 TaxID=1629710 RepID=UPI000AA9C641|nr:hypothetical protein [Hyphomonas sp. BRH_c22]
MSKIFLSVGSPSTKAQEAFIDNFRSLMMSAGLKPLTADSSSVRPFDNINSTMRKAEGVIVLALERYHVSELVERRGADLDHREESILKNVAMPTTWNQVEAAFAHAWKLPLLVFREQHVWEDALLDRGNDWYVHPIRTDGSSKDLLVDQLLKFAEKVRKTRRPIWHIWRSAGLLERLGAISALLAIGAVLGQLIAIVVSRTGL